MIIRPYCKTVIIVLLYYRTTHSFFPCKFYNVSPYFYMFYFVHYHICVRHVSINITYLLLTYKSDEYKDFGSPTKLGEQRAHV